MGLSAPKVSVKAVSLPLPAQIPATLGRSVGVAVPCAKAALYWVAIAIVAVAVVVHWICAPPVVVFEARTAVAGTSSPATMASGTRGRFTRANPLQPWSGARTELESAILADRMIRYFGGSGRRRVHFSGFTPRLPSRPRRRGPTGAAALGQSPAPGRSRRAR